MKVHAPIFLPPSPAASAPLPARTDPQLASTKAPMAFDQSVAAKPDSEQPAPAGHKSHSGRGGATRRLPAPTLTNPPAATSSAEAPVEASEAKSYAPGSIIDIEA